MIEIQKMPFFLSGSQLVTETAATIRVVETRK
jgi:hypothetical protein